MAKFFNQKVKKGRSKTKSNNNKVLLISIIAVVAVIIIGVLISVFFRNSHDDAIVKIRDVIAIEVNNENVDKNLFFEQLENVKEKDIKITYKNVDFSEVGTYDVVIKIYGKKYNSKIQIVDTEIPELIIKDVKINIGESYKANDFVKSCQDNSNKDCIIDFYDLSLDQKGEKIDYRNYTKEGSYEILIVASDASGNKTSPMKATLTIGNDTVVKPITCKYGNAEYDTTNILAVNVTKEGCALDLNLYNDENVLAPVNELIKSENEKIKKEINDLKKIIIEQNSKNKQNKKQKIKEVKELNSQKEIICILGSGGVGKSIFTVNLAKSLIYSKKKILIIDFDILNNSLHTILGVKKYSEKISKKIKENNLIKNSTKNIKLNSEKNNLIKNRKINKKYNK